MTEDIGQIFIVASSTGGLGRHIVAAKKYTAAVFTRQELFDMALKR
jgi:hypothetical protein